MFRLICWLCSQRSARLADIVRNEVETVRLKPDREWSRKPMTAINPKWVDVDFQQHAKVDGLTTGALPRGDMLGSRFSILEDEPFFRVIPEAERRELIAQHKPIAPLVAKIKDQGNEGSCASNAAAQVFETCGNFACSLENWVELSAISLYKRVGRSPNSGSTIDGNLRELTDRGILPVDNAENRSRFAHVHPPRGFYERLPEGWEETARRFLILEWFDIRSWDGLISALLYKMPVCYGRAGHAIAGVDPVVDNGRELIKYANSWGNWGDGGFGYDSRRAVESAIPGYGAWSARVVAWVAMDPFPSLTRR